MITLLFFAHLADQAKVRLGQTPFGSRPQYVAEGFDCLEDRSMRVAVNRRWAHWDTPLSDGDEVAFLPPLGAL